MNCSRITLLALTAALAIGITSCSSVQPEQPAPAQAAFPVTIDVPGAKAPLVIEEEPERIAVLSPDAAIALHELGLTNRIVAVPRGATSEALNPYAEELSAVPNVIAAENSPEPEQVLSWSPDLIVVTARHTGEQDASETLGATGVPVLSLTNGWSSTEDVIENLELIGQATGTNKRAAELGKEIQEGIAEVEKRAADASERPTVAILSNQAHAPFINAGPGLVSEIVKIGGGSNAADSIGLQQTMPIQAEQLVAAHPDYIMLVDVTGKGEGSFDAVMGNPAVAALPAVTEGRVRTFLGKEMYALAGLEVVSASDAVLAWLHPDLAR